MCRDMGVGPGWDCGRCRLDGPNGLLLHYGMDNSMNVVQIFAPQIKIKFAKQSEFNLIDNFDSPPCNFDTFVKINEW